MKNKVLAILTFACLLNAGCDKLDENFNDSLVEGESGAISATDILFNIYRNDMRALQGQEGVWAIQEHTTDECIGPTRGGDWDDNGIWRVLHAHTWDANHNYVRMAFENLGKIIFSANQVLAFNPTPQQAAEARFLRAFAEFFILEGWNQVPFRLPDADPLTAPSVRVGAEALDYIISELEAVIPTLPNGEKFHASKNAARVLLMKCYLTKGVVANRAAPTFAAADMARVLTLGTEITGYTLNANFYDNFAPTNNSISTENIFTGENIGNSSSGNVRSRYFCSLHYNTNPSGWNGFTTLGAFYDKFEASDKRRGDAYAGVTNVSGLRVGLLLGQQVNQNGVALQDRNGRPLAFTKTVKAVETDQTTLEVTGIRVVKYPPDFNNGDNVDNDFVIFRYADVLLMMAEAHLRNTPANPAAALLLVNQVRVRAGASALGSVNLDQLLDERGRELYWEGWRRMDQIRFGKFLSPDEVRTTTSPESRLLFPIPAQQIAANPNLTQNPGY